MGYGMTIRLHTPFAETTEKVRAALQEQGFGVLTEIDVQATLRNKLGAGRGLPHPRCLQPAAGPARS